MPEWMRQSVLSFSGPEGFSGAGGERACPVHGLPLPTSKPTYDGLPMGVARVRGMNASTFYWKYARPGVPVILAGALDEPGAAARADSIRKCCADEYEHKAAIHNGVVPEGGCDLYDGRSWCKEGVQICGLHRKYDCRLAASLNAQLLPPGMSAALSLPQPLPSLDDLTERFDTPYVCWSSPEDTWHALLTHISWCHVAGTSSGAALGTPLAGPTTLT